MTSAFKRQYGDSHPLEREDIRVGIDVPFFIKGYCPKCPDKKALYEGHHNGVCDYRCKVCMEQIKISLSEIRINNQRLEQQTEQETSEQTPKDLARKFT